MNEGDRGNAYPADPIRLTKDRERLEELRKACAALGGYRKGISVPHQMRVLRAFVAAWHDPETAIHVVDALVREHVDVLYIDMDPEPIDRETAEMIRRF